MAKAKLLIVDDDRDLTDLLNEFLGGEGFQVYICHSGESGLEAVDETFDLVLLDVMLPGIDGFEVLKTLRRHYDTPVLMLTAKGDELDCVLGLELGADDYLPKPYRPRELLARIKALVRRRQGHLSGEVKALEVNGIRVDLKRRQATVDQQVVELTQTEFGILCLLVASPDTVISKQTLSEEVLERPLQIHDRSIDMHVSNLRKKLHRYRQQEIIKTLRGSGYLLMASS